MLKHFPMIVACGLVIGLGAVAGCKKPPRASIVTGMVDVQSFSSANTRLVAANDRGDAVDIPVAADGSFRAKLRQGATWGLFVATDEQIVPVVLRQRDAQAEATVRVETGGAMANLGMLRLWPGASSEPARSPQTTEGISADIKVALRPPAEPLPASQGASPVACASTDDMDSDCDSDSEDDYRGHHDDDRVADVQAPALADKLDTTSALAVAAFDLPDTLYCAEFVDDDSDSDSDDAMTGEADDD